MQVIYVHHVVRVRIHWLLFLPLPMVYQLDLQLVLRYLHHFHSLVINFLSLNPNSAQMCPHIISTIIYMDGVPSTLRLGHLSLDSPWVRLLS